MRRSQIKLTNLRCTDCGSPLPMAFAPGIAPERQGNLFVLLRGEPARQWRKPLRIDEVNRMATTPEVRERRGRP